MRRLSINLNMRGQEKRKNNIITSGTLVANFWYPYPHEPSCAKLYPLEKKPALPGCPGLCFVRGDVVRRTNMNYTTFIDQPWGSWVSKYLGRPYFSPIPVLCPWGIMERLPPTSDQTRNVNEKDGLDGQHSRH